MGDEMKYEILDDQNNVIDRIIADAAFVESRFPGRYRVMEETVMTPFKPILTRLEFMQRFTLQERKDIRTAAKSNKDVEDMMQMLEIASFIDVNRADTIAMVNALESAGLLVSGRAAQILS